MRVTSALWVGAYTRRCFGEGAMAAVLRKGSQEAGTIFVTVDRLDGTLDLYGPAPQSIFDETKPVDRLFQAILVGVDQLAISERLEREMNFDPDLWVVAIEDRAGRSFLDLIRDDAADI